METHGPTGKLSEDTSADAERIQIEIWRKMSPLEKARAVSDVTLAAQEMSLAGIQERHPDASERERMLRLAILKLGPTLTRVVYPDAAVLLGS
jgi:hypothetical protein